MSACRMDDSPYCYPGTCKYCDESSNPRTRQERKTAELELRLLAAEALLRVAASYADEPGIPVGLKMYAQDCKKYFETVK